MAEKTEKNRTMKPHQRFSRFVRPPKVEKKWDEDYIAYEEKEKIVKSGDGENDWRIEKYTEQRRVNIDKHINSFASEVDVKNILAKVAKTGDTSLLNQTPIKDYDTTMIPENYHEAAKMMDKQKSIDAFNALPKELRGDDDMETFIKNLSKEKIESYINKVVEAKMTQTPKEVQANE